MHVDRVGCFLQGDVGTKVNTPGTGKNVVEEAGKLLHGEAVQTPLYLSPVFIPDPQHLPLLYFLKMTSEFLCLI
jgi:hypothetical protein